MEEDGKSGPKLPVPGKRNILITSALPYVNKVPHLGNIIGCVLSADVYARYCRLRGYNAIYISGTTNEYGTGTETKATDTNSLEESYSPKEICDKYHAIHKEVYDWFDISFDKFGQTSTPQHTKVSQAIFNKLWENKWLKEPTMQQLYCDTCGKFLADQLIEGSCPFEGCNSYGSARDSLCKNCEKLLTPIKIKDLMCEVCQTTPRIRLIELPLLEYKLMHYIVDTSVTGSWIAPQVPKAHKALRLGSRLRLITSTPQCASRHLKHSMQPTMAWIWEGPMQRGTITRDLKLDRREKYEEDKVFYSWFDAPIGYLSITSCYTSEWDKWWKNPENVELYQFIGKESVPFHTVMFPSAQLGTGESWTMMKTISVTEYLKYEGGEFSKSKGVGVFGDDVKDTSIPVEVWRYYLLTKRPEVSDTSFGWKDLQAKLNNELRSNLGKFVNRVLSFIAKPECAGYYGCVIPVAPHAESHIRTKLLGEKVGGLVEEYVKAMEKVKLRQGLHIAMRISAEGNRYLRDNNFLRLYKEDKPSCGVVMRSAAGLVHLLAQLLEPFMPSFSREVFKQLNLPPHFSLGETLEASRLWEILPHNHRIGTPQPLFMELKDEQVQRYKEKFAGTLVADRGARDAESTRLDPRRFRPVEAASQARRRRRGSLF